MPSGIPVVRLFVSSTFADFEHERRVLNTAVFPRLREQCAQLGAHLHVIDLRWGVTDEASQDQRAVPICLDEVERCREGGSRPYLLVLLGQRYGWRPPPAAVTTSILSRLREVMTGNERQLVDEWYREDRNAVPPEYRLRPRTAGYENDREWKPVQVALRESLRRAAAAIGVSEPERWAFEASVTEQEIRHGLSPFHAGDGSVLAFVRTISGVEPGDPAATAVLDVEDGIPDAAAARAAGRLRGEVLAALGPYTREYRTGWDHRQQQPEQSYLDQLGNDVFASVAAAVRTSLMGRWRATWQQEDELHDAFGQERRRWFVGRQEVLRQLNRLLAEHRAPVLVSGEPGSGKTALLAQLAITVGGGEQARVVRFSGATPRSVALRTFLHDVTCSLRDRRGEQATDEPRSATEAVAAFRDELDASGPSEDCLVVLDGVDQLDAAVGDVDVSWLPTRLPAGVQLVVSARAGQFADAVQRHLEEPPVLLPAMPLSDGEQLLVAWLGALRHPRSLQERQRGEVLRSFRARGLPLQLRLATEEARHWASWTEVRDGELADEVAGLVEQFFERLESEHGQLLARAALGCITAAKHGVSEEELLDLLSLDARVRAEVERRNPVSPQIEERVPPVLLVRLCSDLEPYLHERSADGTALLGFFHNELGERARRRYLTGDPDRTGHALLADYFAAQPLHLGDGHRPNMRKLSELPYQLACAQRWDQLHGLLTDVTFLEAKVRWGGADSGVAADSASRRGSSGVYELQDDLAFALSRWPAVS